MGKERSSPTMADVAREAGVALGTVSRVVNGQQVGEEFKAKVEAAIQHLGYQYNSSGIDMAADIFIAKYGHECTLYAMMVYFGNYMTEYKQSYAQFDIQDILQQFGKKFLPWWRQRLEPERPKTETTAKLTGMDALYRMLADRLLDGQTLDDIRQCSLFRWGFVKEEDLPKILEIAQDSF